MMQWIQKLSLAPLALALTLVGGATASAQSPTISDERARQIALEHVPGEVLELERDDEDGRAEIEIEVRAQDGRVHEVTLDASTGAVITIEEETEDDENDQD